AQTEIEQLAEIAPRDARVWMKLGAVFYEQKMYDRASDAFRRVVMLEPTNLRARYFLATTYMDAGKDTEARPELERILRADRRVIAIDPKHAEAYNYVGYMYAERGQNLDEAISLIGQALSLEPDNGYFIDSLGWAYYQQGKYPDALRELKRAVEKAKEDP